MTQDDVYVNLYTNTLGKGKIGRFRKSLAEKTPQPPLAKG